MFSLERRRRSLFSKQQIGQRSTLDFLFRTAQEAMGVYEKLDKLVRETSAAQYWKYQASPSFGRFRSSPRSKRHRHALAQRRSRRGIPSSWRQRTFQPGSICAHVNSALPTSNLCTSILTFCTNFCNAVLANSILRFKINNQKNAFEFARCAICRAVCTKSKSPD